ILYPPTKRIEKILSAKRSRNSAPDDAASLIASSQKARSEKTWIITDGSVGMEAQGRAVAEAVGLPFSLRRVRTTGAMKFLPAPLQLLLPPPRLLCSLTAQQERQTPRPPRI